jgi:hypothetical protein
MFRSIIYVCDGNNYKMINYTYNNISYETKVPETILNQENVEIYDSYDGTNITVFNWNNNWYYATTKCLNMFESKFNSEMSHGNMFIDAL